MMDKKAFEKERKALLRRELKEYMKTIGDITNEERKTLAAWVADGNSVFENPYLMTCDDGYPLDYIDAIRTAQELYEQFLNSVPEEAAGMGSRRHCANCASFPCF